MEGLMTLLLDQAEVYNLLPEEVRTQIDSNLVSLSNVNYYIENGMATNGNIIAKDKLLADSGENRLAESNPVSQKLNIVVL